MGLGPSNADRAEWAMSAIDHFQDLVDPASLEDFTTMAGDLVTDILHALRRENDWDEAKLGVWLTGRLILHNQEVEEDNDD